MMEKYYFVNGHYITEYQNCWCVNECSCFYNLWDLASAVGVSYEYICERVMAR